MNLVYITVRRMRRGEGRRVVRKMRRRRTPLSSDVSQRGPPRLDFSQIPAAITNFYPHNILAGKWLYFAAAVALLNSTF